MELPLSKELTHKQYIKRAKSIQFFEKLANGIFKPKSKLMGKEMFIDTNFGKIRILVYGFENKSKSPVFFDLHGGGFVLGSADMDEIMNIEFNKQIGCKVISIDYAKAPENQYPKAINQIYAIINYFYDNAEKYFIDINKLAIGGHSAGGNLSTVICLKAKKEGKFRFVCQVLDYPPLDLATSAYKKPSPKGCIPPQMATMFDRCYCDFSQLKEPYVSPVYATQEELKGLPPALFIIPGMDSLHDEGVMYYNMLKAVGVTTELYEYPSALHGFTYKPSADANDAIEKIIMFLQKYL